MREALIIVALISLSACTSSTPRINIIDSMGMTMELNAEAKGNATAAVSPDGRYALSAGTDKVIRLWDLAEGRLNGMLAGDWGAIGVTQAAFSPDGRFIVSAGHEDAIRLWDAASGKELKRFTGHKRDFILGFLVNYAGFSPDGSRIISGSRVDKTIKVRDIGTSREVLSIPGVFHYVQPVFTPDGKYILAGMEGDIFNAAYVVLWDARTGKQVKKFKHSYNTPGYDITAVDISSDGKYVLAVGKNALSGEFNSLIKIWDMRTGKEIKKISGDSSFVGSTAAVFSPDGKQVLFGGGENVFRLWDLSAGREIKRFAGHSEGPLGVNLLKLAFLPDGQRFVSTGTDASLRLWDIASGKEMAMMVGFEDGEWLVVTSEGYYNASEKGAQYLKVKYEGKDFTVDQFYDVFYRPDIVAAKLRGEETKDLTTITLQDAIKSPPPSIEFVSGPPGSDQPRVKVCYKVKNSGGGIGEVRLFQNGKLIQSDGYYRDIAKSSSEKQQLLAMNSKDIYEDMRSVSVKGKTEITPFTSKPKGDIYEDCSTLDAVPGENELSISAFNSNNTVQSPVKTVKFTSTRKPDPSHLYILAIGIDQYNDKNVNLKYAVKDAKDIEEKLRQQSESLYAPGNIHYTLLANEQATKAAILEKISEMAQTIKATDSFVLFVAGHGVLLQNQYYMLTHDYDGAVSDRNMISSNEIVEMSKKIRSLSQLFIFDTCHAGGMDAIVSGLYDARMSVLAKKMGLHVYASASSVEEAMDGYQGNGLFSHTLLLGLNNNRQADKNNDGKVSIVELGEYARTRTTDLSKGLGHVQTPFIINFGKDSPVYSVK